MAADIKHYAMFINGKHVESADVDGICDPATEEVVPTIARGGLSMLTPPLRPLAHARQCRPDLNGLPDNAFRLVGSSPRTPILTTT